MGALLTSIASIGNQFGEAKDAARQEKSAIAEKAQKIDSEQAYLQLAKQAEQRQRDEFEQRKKAGDLIEFKDGRIWSVSKGGFVDQKRPDPMNSLREFIKTLPKELQSDAAARATAELEANPNDPKAAISEVMHYSDAQKAESNKRADQEKAEENRRADNKTREEERRQDKTEAEHWQERMQKMMVDFRLDEKQKYMTPQDRQVFQSIKQVAPSVDRALEYLENTKGEDGKPLKEENAYVFGDRSALMQHLRQRGYKFGTKQEDISQNLIKNAALIQVLGARPWMTMGRGKFIYETISQHLPAATDTPANMYDKLLWLRDNVLSDARDSLSDYVQPGGANRTPQGSGEGTESNPIVIP